MVQFKANAQPLPTPASSEWLDDATWALIRRALEAQGEGLIARGTVVAAPTGTPIYVVVVERPAERLLPSVAQVRGRWGVTEREAEVALLCGRRLSVAEMAAELGVTTHTVRRHVEQILVKLEVRRRLDVGPALEALAKRARAAAAHAEVSDQVRRARRVRGLAA
jgi:DNA-binding CsgD family transcriptional regulator